MAHSTSSVSVATPCPRRHFFRADGDTKDVTWLRPDGSEMTTAEWDDAGNDGLGMLIHWTASEDRDDRGRPTGGESLLILLNGGPRSRSFTLPKNGGPGAWEELLNTARSGGRVVKTPAVNLVAHSLVLLQRRRV